MQTMTVFSDYICPFCFIGKRTAEALAGEFPIQPVWKGFEIHPEVPPEGIPIAHFTPEMISSLEARVVGLAEEIGLEMRMPERLSNSHLALLGAEFARENDRLNEYHEAVFRAYFQQGKDIGDIEELVEITRRIGMDTDSFRRDVTSGRHEHMLEASLREARSLSLTAVPSFVFADGSIVVGVQSYDVFRPVAEKSLQA